MKKNSPLGFKMPHNTDSIAATKHWKAFKSGYMNRSQFTPEYNKKEYDREKHEFYYDTQRNKLRLVPTDDGEVPMKGFKEKLKSWQLPPLDRKSPLNQNGTEPHADSEWENATYQLMNEGKISETDDKSYPLIEARVKKNKDVTRFLADGSYDMTPGVSEEEAKKVRDKFDRTYMKEKYHIPVGGVQDISNVQERSDGSKYIVNTSEIRGTSADTLNIPAGSRDYRGPVKTGDMLDETLYENLSGIRNK